MCWRTPPVLDWPFWVSACQCKPWLSKASAHLGLQWRGLLQVDSLSEVPSFPKYPNPWIHSSLKHWSYNELDLCSCGQGDRSGLCSEALLIGEINSRRQLWREEILLEYRAGYGRTDLSVFSVNSFQASNNSSYISIFDVIKLCVLTWDKNM